MKFLTWLKTNIGSVLVHIAAALATIEALTNTISLPNSVRVGLVTASAVVVAAERIAQNFGVTVPADPTATATAPPAPPNP